MEKNIVLSLKDVSFSYPSKGSGWALSKLSLSVEEGSFTTLLGPSGCGKTTLLNLIAGFLEPTEGSIVLGGRDQKGISPEKREIGVVFQDYALFPHLTVKQNILYGLKLRKLWSKDEMEKMVAETAGNLDLEMLLDRYPHELSGGQQQRVALARALVLKPKLLLMDEPLSSLDSKLRVRVREELKEIQERYHMTTVYVTHDQEEALSLSDEIAVLDGGRLLQTGSPLDLYFRPESRFVADFVGRANFLVLDGKECMVRPEWLTPEEDGEVEGKVLSVSFLGEKTRLKLETSSGSLVADVPSISLSYVEKGMKLKLKVTHCWNMVG